MIRRLIRWWLRSAAKIEGGSPPPAVVSAPPAEPFSDEEAREAILAWLETCDTEELICEMAGDMDERLAFHRTLLQIRAMRDRDMEAWQ